MRRRSPMKRWEGRVMGKTDVAVLVLEALSAKVGIKKLISGGEVELDDVLLWIVNLEQCLGKKPTMS